MTMLSKPTIDDIEAHGYKVLTKSEYEQMKQRLETLESLHGETCDLKHALALADVEYTTTEPVNYPYEQ